MSVGSPTLPASRGQNTLYKMKARTPWVASSYPFCTSRVLEAEGSHLRGEDTASVDVD